jgi:hypothetical protein
MVCPPVVIPRVVILAPSAVIPAPSAVIPIPSIVIPAPSIVIPAPSIVIPGLDPGIGINNSVRRVIPGSSPRMTTWGVA